MSIRRQITAILIAVVVFTCLPLIRAVLVYCYPALGTNFIFDLFINLISLFLAIALFAAIISVIKRTRKYIKVRYDDQLLEQTYRNIVEDSGVSSIVIDPNGVIKFASKNVERLTGYSPAEIMEKELQITMPTAYRQQVNDIITKLLNYEAYDDTIIVQVYTKARVNKWISCRMYPVKDEAGKIRQLQLMVWDIDNEKKMQMELQSTESARKSQQQLLQTIIDYCPVIIYLKNLKGEIVLTNSRMKNLAGLSAENDSPISPKMNNRAEKNKLYEEYDRRVIEEKRMVTFEDEFVHRNGKTTHYYLMKFPIFNKEGEIEYICNFSTDVSSLKKSERLMLEAKKEAEKAKEAQETFMANMSHEIRTPMNGILGMSNLLMGAKLDDEHKEYIQAIQESAKNLLAIINDLLDFSKIKSGKFHLESVEFKPRQAIKKAMYPLLFRANEKKLPLKCFVDTSVPENLMGDPLRLQQVIINLVGNAVKFTESGSVEVKVYTINKDENTILLNMDVIDTGIGIPDNKLENIFESYTQTDTNISRIYGGTGLGLAIVKQLVEMQEGRVTVKSEMGKGSVFTVQIPYLVIHGQNELQVAPKTDNKETSNMLSNIRILVAEDNLINQKVVERTLTKQNAYVQVVANGKLAVEKLRYEKFDIVLMDLQMPEMDGYEATAFIRKELGITIPIVAMTADAISGESDKCIDVGMNGYISKPFEAIELYHKILDFTKNNN